jgi:anti-anti-sigma factor
MGDEQLRLKVKHEGQVIRISFLDAELTDDLVIEQMGQYFNDLTAETPNARIVLDFSGVTRCISRMFGVLASFGHKASGTGVQLRLCGLDEHLLEAFRITRLDTRFKILPTAAEAMKSFKP